MCRSRDTVKSFSTPALEGWSLTPVLSKQDALSLPQFVLNFQVKFDDFLFSLCATLTGPSVSYSMSPINQWGMEGLTVEWSSQSVMAVWLSGSWPAELGSWERAWDFHQNLRCHPQPWLSHSCRFSSSDRGCHLPSLEERSCSIHPEVPDDHTKRTKNSVRRICSTAVQVPATTLTN